MPLSRYDQFFGGKGGAAKAMDAMVSQHGAEKGKSVFFATIKEKKKRGP
ncbi:hypothetical protein LCGC14_0929380 [marine sediment metagenome]|uniref:Uncharacterized protein n=1 Tax=marine sediment metagenome TaxID=412755 RepID=A0A0F9NNF0_9ZZZZ